MIFLKDIKILLLPIFYNIFFMNNVSSSTVESNYASLKNKKFKDLDPRNIYISFETVFTKYECFSACNKDERCVLLFFNSNKCRLFKFIPTRNIIDSKSTFLYKKLNNRFTNLNDGLLNYWSFTNSVNDSVGTADLYDGVNVNLVQDRFNRPNSAMNFASGYFRIPAGVYFSGPFTVTAWVNPQSFQINSRLMEFSDASGRLVLFTICDGGSLNPRLVFFRNAVMDTYGVPAVPASSNFKMNTWSHLAFVYDGNIFSLYSDGNKLIQTSNILPPNAELRTTNYMGRSNWYSSTNNLNVDAIFDEIRIYNRSLSESEILDLISF